MGCEFALHFDYTLPGMEKVEKDKVLSLARYGVFCKMWAQFQKIPKKIKKKTIQLFCQILFKVILHYLIIRNVCSNL